MKQIQLKITAESPLAIGRKKPGSVSEAEDYIPGSVIRGAIAAAILQSGQPEPGDDFAKLFLDDSAAVFHNAYPTGQEVNASVIPATALSSKTNPGFKDKGYGVFDTLIDRFCAQSYGHPYDPNCPTDGGRVEPFSGFYTQVDKNYQSHSVSKRLLTRVGINRRRATAEEQILYSLEVLNEAQGKLNKPVVYRSSILINDNGLAKLLAEYINKQTFRLGGAISRGLGKVKIEATCVDIKSNIQTRIAKFNQELQQRWQAWGTLFGSKEEGDRTYFTLNLQADAILADNWRRTTVITPAMLCQFANLEDSSLQLQVAYSSYDYRSGWNTAWGLMKDVELVTNKGAVYLFSTSQFNLWLPALEKLEITGIGERTTEGFGQVQVCNSFHLVLREGAK